MATELAIAQGFQTLFQAMTEFSNADVVINDDTVLDGAMSNLPLIIIYTVEDFDLTPAPSRTNSVLTVPVMHVEEFSNWKDSYDNFRTNRQAIWDEVFTGVGMSANGLDGVMVRRISNQTGIEGINPEPDTGGGTTTPTYLFQLYGIEVELFW